jgi:serine/threonine protein kinase
MHDNILPMCFASDLDGDIAVFSEWADDGTLKDWIDSGKLYEGSEKEIAARVLKVSYEMAQGLKHIQNNGYIHGDIKPSNVFFTSEGITRIGDFGSMLSYEKWRKTRGYVPVSVSPGYTAKYASPEQLAGQEITALSDVYSFALTVLEMCTGKTLWDNGADVRLTDCFSAARIPVREEIRKMLSCCLTRDLKERIDNLRNPWFEDAYFQSYDEDEKSEALSHYKTSGYVFSNDQIIASTLLKSYMDVTGSRIPRCERRANSTDIDYMRIAAITPEFLYEKLRDAGVPAGAWKKEFRTTLDWGAACPVCNKAGILGGEVCDADDDADSIHDIWRCCIHCGDVKTESRFRERVTELEPV